MKRALFKITLLAAAATAAAACSAQRTVTVGSLLDEMVSKRAVTEFPAHRTLQQSSYDRRSVSPDLPGWFANDDGFGFIRTDTVAGRTEKVLFEDAGPGVLTRIWLTTKDPAGTLRFYFDGSAEPGWIVPAYDLMQFGIPALGRGLLQPHTSYEAGRKGGSTLYLPIPYARSCRVTLEEPSGAQRVPHYYHFNYRKYPVDTRVETFSARAAEKYARRIARTDALLRTPGAVAARGRAAAVEGRLGRGDSLAIDLPEGPRFAEEIVFRVDGFAEADYGRLMRGLVFSAEFDGRQTVWAPLADFSGGGVGAPAVESWFLSSDGKGRVTCRWPMPYRHGGRLILYNASDVPCRAAVTARTDKYGWTDRSLYFHTTWKQERGLPFCDHLRPQRPQDWNFVTLTGRGVYRGDVLSLFNHTFAWYGEGDEKIWVDGGTFPAHFGTGVEDYYNSSWAPVIPFHTPFGGAPRADLPSSGGYNAFLRTRHLDDIPFGHGLRFDMEMLGWVDGTADYAATCYWYGDADAAAAESSGIAEALAELPPPPEDPSAYRIPGAIELEQLPYGGKSDRLCIDRQDMSAFAGGRWSGAAHLLGYGGQPGDYVDFVLDGVGEGPLRLRLYATRAADYATLSVRVNGREAAVVDLYDARVVPTGAIELGEVVPERGRIELRFTIAGKNPSSSGYVFGLDCITLTER